MKLEDCYLLGYVSRKFGYKGELVLKLDVDFPEEYAQLDSVLVLMKRKLVPFFIEKSQLNPNGSLRVKFEGVDDENMQEKLVGSELYLPLEVLPTLEGNAFYYHEVVGFTIIDENYGEAGQVVEVLDQTVQPIIVGEKDGKELMVPVTDAILKKVDRENKQLLIHAPDGLLEMYLNEE